MNKHQNQFRLLFIALAAYSVISCDGSPNEMPQLALDKPLAARQILAFENSTLRVDIVVNNGETQSFNIPPQSDFFVDVAGINLGQPNSIAVKWTEILNGFDVELSEQSQVFQATGNIQIDAPHRGDQYDYDNDGASNVEERAAGTCVWSASELCLGNGQSDIPSTSQINTPTETPTNTIFSPTTQTPFNYDNAQNLITNGDISNGTDLWFSLLSPITANNGIICSDLFPGPVATVQSVLTYVPLIELPLASYSIEFDVMASKDNRLLNIGLWQNNISDNILDHVLSPPISTAWERRRLTFTNDVSFRETVSIVFQAAVDPDETVSYCFDNIAFYRDDS